MIKRSHFQILALALALSGCSYYNPKNVGGSAGHTQTSLTQVGYSQVRDQVFTPKCIGCHSSGGQSPALDSYASVKGAINEIEQMAIVRQAMPPRRPLPQDLSDLLSEWIADGAPLGNAGPLPNPSVEPSSEPSPGPTSIVPVAPTFPSILANVIETKCASCHGAGGPASDAPLDSVADLLSEKLITPGNASTSKLYILIEKRAMPPKSSGLTLSDQEIQAVGQWIQSDTTDEPVPAPSASPEPLPSPEPAPSLVPLVPTFSAIHADIFETKCLICHSAGGRAANVPLDTLNDVLADKIITPGNPTASRLYTLVAAKKMPPQGTTAPLTDEEIQTISEWIQQGTPQ
jgi:mono/diheme cytochrome c family protein